MNLTTDNPGRWRYELRRAIDQGQETMTELLPVASLSMLPAVDGICDVLSNGTKVGQLPLWRLLPIDPETTKYVAIESVKRADHFPADADPRQACLSALQRDRYVVIEPDATDLVHLYILATETDPPLCLDLFRPQLIPAWPHWDHPEPPAGHDPIVVEP